MTSDGPRWPRVLDGGARRFPLDLYTGAAGVALFLGTAAAVAGDAALAETARAGLDAAWRRAAARPSLNPAVVCGEGGLLQADLALARLGVGASPARIAERAALLVDRAEVSANELFYGAAGAGVTFLSAHRVAAAPGCLEAAIACGEHLERTARAEPDGTAWWPWGRMKDGYEDDSPYVGLAHGTAGVALFLVELHAATGDARWRALADRALSWVVARGQRRFGGLVFPVHHLPGSRVITYWCHGAAGVAVALLAAARVTGATRWRDAARDAVAATDQFLASHEVRWCGQCHGVAGNLEPLIEAAAVLDEPAWLERARAHADRLLLRRRTTLDGEPFYVPAETPAPSVELGTGRSGVGLALLRLARPELPHFAGVLPPEAL